ncbi:MAG: hypothetical protein K2X47_12410 [Bdellovibrionales bacterium]|nr:hypothetical protein [Bdellovibrionales bacterium]
MGRLFCLVAGVIFVQIFSVSTPAAPARVRAFPADTRASQRRHPVESYKTSIERYFRSLNVRERKQWKETVSPVSAAVPWKEWTGLSRLPRLTFSELQRSFFKIRDSRYIESAQGPHFLRRNSWLYPDDGCWSRAALMKDNVTHFALPAPRKVFAFGNLTVSTANNPGGSVSWWYHVVPLVQVEGVPYVYDPAIDPRQPLTLVQWIQRMGGDKTEVKISDCDPKTFSPSSSCDAPDPEQEKEALTIQKQYLEYEWERLVQMGRDPVRELGDLPPWPVDMRDVRGARRPR